MTPRAIKVVLNCGHERFTLFEPRIGQARFCDECCQTAAIAEIVLEVVEDD